MLMNAILIIMCETYQNVLSEQMGLVWKAAAEHNNLTVQQLGAVEMVALNQFICGLNSSEFKQLNLEAFKLVLHTEYSSPSHFH